MKPTAIYSKSGKGVQEASGKTSLLKRADRAVLSAIDGRATLAEVAGKVGRNFDAPFQQLISQLDRDGFVREVTAAPATASQSRPAVAVPKPAAKAAAAGGVDDLDFTAIMPAVKRTAAAPAPAAAPKPDPSAAQRAKEQEAALYKARQEAEARAQAERDRVRLEAEAKARAEAEVKIRAETEKKLREEAQAKVKAEAEAAARAARETALRIAAEAKAKAEAEAQAKIEAERRIREEAERKAREEAEKARREAEELRLRLEEERKAREAEEKRRKEEEERRRREEEERRLRAEIEAKAREAAEQARREEEDRRLKEKEEQARRAREEEEMRALQARAMEEARAKASQRHAEEAQRARRAAEETKTREPAVPFPALETSRSEPAAPGGSLDALMADLDSFSQREEEERQAREAVEQQAREEKKRKVQADVERRAREQAAEMERARQRAAEEARRREEEEQRAQAEAERRMREAEEQRRLEAEERKRRAQELATRPSSQNGEEDIKVTEDDLGMDDVRRDEAAVAREARRAQREREREARQRSREAKERAEAAAREANVRYPKARRPVKWGRPVATLFFVLLVGGVAALHVVPLPMADFEKAASQALGRPVTIGSGRLSLFTGVRLNLENVSIPGVAKIARAHAYPRIGSLIDEDKKFRRIELDGVTVPQQAIGAAVGAKLKGDALNVGRIVVKNLRLEGPVPLPALEAEAVVGADGAIRSVTLRGPDSLNARLTPGSGGEVEFDVTAASLPVPFVPELTLSSFAMKGVATASGMKVASWGGSALDGALSGTANVRWSSQWQVDGTLAARNINAAVFAPALLSEGKAEANGRFSMAGAEPAKLYNGARLEGSFMLGKGALGSFDLSRVLQTSGRQHGGRTPFTELTGQGVYDRGVVTLRNVSLSAGALHAGASADIAPSGVLAGRIVADIRTNVQPLRAILVLGGTVKEPQVRN